MVNKVRYINEEHTEILVLPENWVLSLPLPLHRQEIIDAWVAEGNKIRAFNKYKNWTIEQALAHKEEEIDDYADRLIRKAYKNPIEGKTVNARRYERQVNRRKSNNIDKIVNGDTFTVEERNQARLDEKLSKYEIRIERKQDLAEENLNLLTTVKDIMKFDVKAQEWVDWVPPAQ